MKGRWGLNIIEWLLVLLLSVNVVFSLNSVLLWIITPFVVYAVVKGIRMGMAKIGLLEPYTSKRSNKA